MPKATIILQLSTYAQGSIAERIYLDILGVDAEPDTSIDVTDKMGNKVFYRVPVGVKHAYRIRVNFGSRLPEQTYQATALFAANESQQSLPITQYVRQAICSVISRS